MPPNPTPASRLQAAAGINRMERAMLTGPELLILFVVLIALYMWDWWRRNWKG